jgi:hypothetical protein
MKAQTLHIEKPSKELLEFFRKLRAEKKNTKQNLLLKKKPIFLNLNSFSLEFRVRSSF